MSTPPPVVRPGTADDVAALTAIYNHYVEHAVATFDTAPFEPEVRARTWFAGFAPTGRHRLLVAEVGGAVAGYVTSGTFRSKPAYSRTVETTVYLHPDHTGRGLGRLLYDALLAALREEGVHLCVAAIALPNPGSVALHEALGFRRVGVLPEVGFKHGRWVDVAWYQLRPD